MAERIASPVLGLRCWPLELQCPKPAVTGLADGLERLVLAELLTDIINHC